MQAGMKVLQLIDSLDTGGAEMMAVNISNALATEGHQVLLCGSRRLGELESKVSKEVALFCLQKKNSFDLKAFWKLFLIVKKNKVDLIHAHSSSVFWALLVRFLTLSRTKVLWHDHFGNRINEKSNIFMILASSWIDYILCVNFELCEWSKKNMRVKPEKIQYINNFPAIAVARKQELENTKSIKIVYLASFRKPKNHLNLIKAFEMYLANAPMDTRLILAGKYHQDSYFFELQNYIKEKKLADFIEFYGNVDNVSNLLEMVHLGVIASDFEGLPLSLLEYGQAELPVVVTNVGQCPEVINHGEFGRLVEKNNPEALANALNEIISNWSSSVLMGKAFKAHIEKFYGVNNFLNQYQALVNPKND